MRCTRWEKWIALYIEGDLPASKARRLEAHLDRCPSCARTLRAFRASQAKLKAADRILREHEAAKAPPRIVFRALSSPRPVRLFSTGRKRPLVAAAAVVATLLVAAAVLLINHPRRRPFAAARATAVPTRTPVQRAVLASPTPAVEAPRAVHTAKTGAGRRPVQRSAEPQAASLTAAERAHGSPTVIKLLTDDPDVIILCIVDS